LGDAASVRVRVSGFKLFVRYFLGREKDSGDSLPSIFLLVIQDKGAGCLWDLDFEIGQFCAFYRLAFL